MHLFSYIHKICNCIVLLGWLDVQHKTWVMKQKPVKNECIKVCAYDDVLMNNAEKADVVSWWTQMYMLNLTLTFTSSFMQLYHWDWGWFIILHVNCTSSDWPQLHLRTRSHQQYLPFYAYDLHSIISVTTVDLRCSPGALWFLHTWEQQGNPHCMHSL